MDALNKLCKWRTVLAGWHIGTKTLTTGGQPTPGVQAMRDLMEKWLIMRAENNAILRLLIDKGVFTAEEFTDTLMHDAELLDKDIESLFPGFRSADYGIQMYDVQLAAKTMKERGFPP